MLVTNVAWKLCGHFQTVILRHPPRRARERSDATPRLRREKPEPFPTNAAMAVGRRITRLACGGQSLTDPFEVRRLFPILLLQHDSKSVPRRGGNKKYKRVASIRSDSSGRSDPSRFVGGWAGDGRVSCTALGAPAFPQRGVRPAAERP